MFLVYLLLLIVVFNTTPHVLLPAKHQALSVSVCLMISDNLLLKCPGMEEHLTVSSVSHQLAADDTALTYSFLVGSLEAETAVNL